MSPDPDGTGRTPDVIELDAPPAAPPGTTEPALYPGDGPEEPRRRSRLDRARAGATGTKEKAVAAWDRFSALDSRLRYPILVVVPVALYWLAGKLPGIGPVLEEKAPLGILVLGVVLGSVTALLAIGLILIYRTNRFINFAYGSMGSLVGVLAIGFHLATGVPFFVVLPLGVAAGVLAGALIEFGVIRRFSNASRLILTVASIGLAQLLGGLELLGAKAIGFISLTGGFEVPISARISLPARDLAGDELLIIALVPAIVIGLLWFLLKTDAGVAVRAAAENADRALLLGIPIKRLSTIVWMLAGGLAALTFILKAPFTGITPGVAANGPTVLLPALAAAVVARMESLPTAFEAAIGLGVLEQLVRWNTEVPAFLDVVFLVVILGGLIAQRAKLSRAEAGGESSWSATGIVKPIPPELRRLPEVRWVKVGLGVLVIAGFIFLPMGWSASRQLLGAIAMVWAMAAVSLVILTGWGGNISLGQFALVGVGGLVGGNVLTRWNTDLFLSLIAAALAGALIALLVGLPALRIKGLFLAVSTLAFAIALDSYFLNFTIFPDLIPTSIDRPFLWERFDLQDEYTMYLVCLAFLGLSVLAALGVRKARSGRVLIATRDNERAADSAAVPTTSIKLSGFLLAGVICGIAGCLHVLILSSLNPGTYSPTSSLDVFSMTVIGGLGSVGGAIAGVLVFRFLETITALGDLRLLLTGTGLLVVLYALPGGFGQLFYAARDRLLRRVADRRGILVPSLVADKREETEDKPEDEIDLLRGALSDAPSPAPPPAGGPAAPARPEPVGAGR
ncbi:hypothetical protein BH24ACT3_BH24ACT3_04580 [soil metagenome]